MSNNHCFMLLLAAVGQLCWLSFAPAGDTGRVTVLPKETDAILANPGMGWETFHRTSGRRQEPARRGSHPPSNMPAGAGARWSPSRARSTTSFWTGF